MYKIMFAEKIQKLCSEINTKKSQMNLKKENEYQHLSIGNAQCTGSVAIVLKRV